MLMIDGGLRMMTFVITVIQDEHGMFVVECPTIPGCVSQGRTVAEAEDNIRDAIRECLAARRELGCRSRSRCATWTSLAKSRLRDSQSNDRSAPVHALSGPRLDCSCRTLPQNALGTRSAGALDGA